MPTLVCICSSSQILVDERCSFNLSKANHPTKCIMWRNKYDVISGIWSWYLLTFVCVCARFTELIFFVRIVFRWVCGHREKKTVDRLQYNVGNISRIAILRLFVFNFIGAVECWLNVICKQSARDNGIGIPIYKCVRLNRRACNGLCSLRFIIGIGNRKNKMNTNGNIDTSVSKCALDDVIHLMWLVFVSHHAYYFVGLYDLFNTGTASHTHTRYLSINMIHIYDSLTLQRCCSAAD